MTVWHGVIFLLCVAVATAAQTLTGFALGLVLLGLVSMFHLAPLADAANVVSILSLANALVLLKGARSAVNLPLLRDTVIGSSVGVVVGVVLLGWLSGNVVLALRGLLGITILGCATLMMVSVTPLRERSSRTAFHFYGIVSGVMGGLFSSAGPPLVYQFYRQPLPLAAIRQTLGLVFAFNAVLRLVLIVPSGHFSLSALWLSTVAVPLVLVVTWLLQRHPPGWSPRVVRTAVCGLLVLAGSSLLSPIVMASW